MTLSTIVRRVDERGVCTLMLNRPEKGNALTEDMVSELRLAALDAAENSDIRAVVLTGNGRHFCAGGDLDWFMQSFEDSREGRIRRSAVLGELYKVLNALPKPLIGRINGSALGAGVGLAAVCDVALTVASARFGFSETRIGLIPATFAPYVIARIGVANARKVMLSGAPFPADVATRIGLLDEASDSETALDERVALVVEEHLAAAPAAIALTKRMIAGFVSEAPGATPERLGALVGDAWETGEARQRLEQRLAKGSR
jgi:methylglutaconyl-CoA hydratase